MSIVFRYSDTANRDGTTAKRPAIPVLFSTSEKRYEIPAIIDSGADMCSLDSRWAKLLKMDLSGKRTTSYGVTGSADTVISHVTMEIGKGHERYQFDVPIRVLFVNESDPYTPTLIGRMGFFDKFRITFDEAGQKITFKHNGPE